MPVPVLVYVIGSAVATGAVAAYAVKNSDGVFSEVTEDVANDLIDAGVPVLRTVGEDVADALGSIGSNLGNATIQVIEYAGPALVDGIENTYDYIRGKLRGREPNIIAAVTVGALTVLAGVYLFNAAKRGTMTYTE